MKCFWFEKGRPCESAGAATTLVGMKKHKSFEGYLKSKKRRALFASHPVFGGDNLEERLSHVHHSDVANFYGSGKHDEIPPARL